MISGESGADRSPTDRRPTAPPALQFLSAEDAPRAASEPVDESVDEPADEPTVGSVEAPVGDAAVPVSGVPPAADDAPTEAVEPVPEPELLLAPRDGLPPVIDADHPLDEAIRALAAGTGPVAVDAERASGYRYGQRAYLVQLRREGAGTFLVDPVGCPDLSSLTEALRGVEWVLHAASQDLPCLAERGFVPDRLFDTELAARLAGHERVGLGTIIEKLLGYRLEKGHSAVDWSTRPLPEPWLRYAALDVELLVDLRDALEEDLRSQGKLEWALEEFAALVDAPPKPAPAEPWRRTSGMHKVRNRRQLAVVRSLWQTRDRVAQRRDTAPGRILPDSAIVEAALAQPADQAALSKLPVFSGPRMRRTVEQWWTAIAEAEALPDDELPRSAGPGAGLPPANRWADRDPEAAERLARARAGLASLSEQYRIPVENLLEPALVRRLAWAPPADADDAAVRAFLDEGLARRWQIQLTTPVLVEAMTLQDSPA